MSVATKANVRVSVGLDLLADVGVSGVCVGLCGTLWCARMNDVCFSSNESVYVCRLV